MSRIWRIQAHLLEEMRRRLLLSVEGGCVSISSYLMNFTAEIVLGTSCLCRFTVEADVMSSSMLQHRSMPNWREKTWNGEASVHLQQSHLTCTLPYWMKIPGCFFIHYDLKQTNRTFYGMFPTRQYFTALLSWGSMQISIVYNWVLRLLKILSLPVLLLLL